MCVFICVCAFACVCVMCVERGLDHSLPQVLLCVLCGCACLLCVVRFWVSVCACVVCVCIRVCV